MACLPWMRAYVIAHTFPDRKHVHRLPSKASWNATASRASIRFTNAYPTLHLFLKSMGK